MVAFVDGHQQSGEKGGCLSRSYRLLTPLYAQYAVSTLQWGGMNIFLTGQCVPPRLSLVSTHSPAVAADALPRHRSHSLLYYSSR